MPLPPLPAAAEPSQGRVLWLDVARGVAIVAMVAYHFSFDLRLFGWVDWAVTADPAWRGFAKSIASTFLFLSGVSLALAYGGAGPMRWGRFGRRLAVVAAAAAGVNLATWFVMEPPIYFGILHAVALFSVLALPFLRLPWAVAAAVGLLVLAVPYVLPGAATLGLWAYPLGLSGVRVPSADYEPVIPWFGAFLLGVAFARAVPPVRRPGPAPAAVAPLALMGRWSLAIYLLHQVVLFGLFAAVASL